MARRPSAVTLPSPLSLSDLYDTRAGADLAVADAVACYPGVVCARPDPALVAAVARRHPGPLQQIIALVRASAAGRIDAAATDDPTLPPAACVHPPLAWRLFAESYLGEALFTRLWSAPRRWIAGPAHIDGERLTRRPEADGLHLRTHRTTPEALYLLARDGLSGSFSVVESHAEPTLPPR